MFIKLRYLNDNFINMLYSSFYVLVIDCSLF